MEIQIIKNKDQWDGWIFTHSQLHHFTQSWAWGEILIAEGKKVERLAVVEAGEVLAQAQVVFTPMLFDWSYAFCPQGPTIAESQIKNYKQSLELRRVSKEENLFSSSLTPSNFEIRIYETIVHYLKQRNIIFLRVEPTSIIHNSRFIIHQSIDISPPATLLLDLNKNADQLRAGMHPKTRYNIALAKRKNIKISQEKNLEVFLSLMNKTGNRDKFGLHNKSHYAAVLAAKEITQLTAYQDATPIAAAVFIGFGNTFTYLYGASDYEYRNLMAPYLLQWEGMEIGNDFGAAWYDFFGVAPQCHPELVSGSISINEMPKQVRHDMYEYDPQHQYAGVTRFKLGFGGIPYQAPGTFDIIVSKNKYRIYSLLRKLRRLF